MRTYTEISARLEELRRNLCLVEEKAREEMEKPLPERNQRTLYFLFQEKKVWEFALMQINWIFSNGDSGIC